MQRPSEQEINPNQLPTIRDSAVQHFLGKSVDEAESMFRQESNFYDDDLLWMGPIAFQYYIPAACRYVVSQLPESSPGTLSKFMTLLLFRRLMEPETVKPVAADLIASCSEILTHSSQIDESRHLSKDLINELQSRAGIYSLTSHEIPESACYESSLCTSLRQLIADLQALQNS